jgi:hypothetical protein
MTDRLTKISFGEMREMGVRGILVYCADYRCSHSIALSGDAWPDEALHLSCYRRLPAHSP